MGQDQASGDGAAQQYVNDISNAFAERARQLELINTQYATDLAGLQPGTLWPDGTARTPQSLYSRYLGSRAYAEQTCNVAVADARTAFTSAAGREAALPRIPDEAIRPEPPVFPAPQVLSQAAAPPTPYVAPARPILSDLPPAVPGPGRKPRKWPAVALLAAVAVAVVAVFASTASGSSSSASSDSGSSTSHYSSTVDVLYEVEGTATGTDVTLESPTGTSQLTGKAVPLGNRSAGTRGIHYTMPRGHFVYLSAQNTDDTGSITCKITVDGVLVASNTSSGGYAIASCSGTAE